MGRRVEKRVLIFVAVFYICVSLLAVGILGATGAIRQKRDSLKDYIKNRDNAGLEMTDAEPLDEFSANMAEETEEDIVETEEAATEESEEVPTTEEIIEEAVSEEKSAPVKENSVEYYSFIANNTKGRLNVRKAPDIRSKVVYSIMPGTKGYVLDIGDEWTRVSVDEKTGYCSNEYLTMSEISEEEFPAELRDQVGKNPIVTDTEPENGTVDETAPEETAQDQTTQNQTAPAQTAGGAAAQTVIPESHVSEDLGFLTE